MLQEEDPPLAPASLAFSLPGSKEPPEALPPMDAISFCKQINQCHGTGGIRSKGEAYLLVGIHGRKATIMASLTAFLSNAGNFFLGTVGKVAGVGIVGHFA